MSSLFLILIGVLLGALGILTVQKINGTDKDSEVSQSGPNSREQELNEEIRALRRTIRNKDLYILSLRSYFEENILKERYVSAKMKNEFFNLLNEKN